MFNQKTHVKDWQTSAAALIAIKHTCDEKPTRISNETTFAGNMSNEKPTSP